MDDPFLLQHAHAAELFIVRHADAIPDEDEIIPSGIYDNLPLSRLGREQAQALAERLSNVSFNAIYSSPLQRCLETAAPLLERIGITPIIVPDLKEIRLGEVLPLPQDGNDLAALTQALQARQVEIVRVAGNTGHWDAIKDSEPSQEFRKRVVDALDEIARHHVGERVLAFAHGGVVNAYVAEVLGLERDFFFPAGHTSITIVRVAGNHRVLFVLNDIAHLAHLRKM
jgi:2,3-bisphosphoglycerate-dependent phosphoglycerate mutase